MAEVGNAQVFHDEVEGTGRQPNWITTGRGLPLTRSGIGRILVVGSILLIGFDRFPGCRIVGLRLVVRHLRLAGLGLRLTKQIRVAAFQGGGESLFSSR